MNILTDDIKQLFYKYLIPSLGSAIVVSIYAFVDTIVVGQYEGPIGAAAMAIITPIFGVQLFLSILSGMGGSVLMSKAKGAQKEEKGNAYFTASFILMVLLTLVFWVVFACFSQQIFTFFGADREVMPYVQKYAYWLIMTCPIFLYSPYIACFIRNDHAPQLTMLAVVLGGVTNIFLDWFLVFPMDMGISGAAIATVIGTLVQCIVLTSHFFSPKCSLKLVRPHSILKAFKNILTIGFAASLLDLAGVFLVAIFNNQIMRYGDASSLAVYGVVATISSLFQSLYSGVGQAVQPLVSMNFGAHKMARIKQLFKYSMTVIAIFSVSFMLLGQFFPVQIIKIFMSATPEVLAITPEIVQTYFITFLFMGVTVFSTYYLQSIMQAKMSLIVALLRGIVVSGSLLFILPLFLNLRGIWLAMPLAEAIVATFTFVYLRKIHKTI